MSEARPARSPRWPGAKFLGNGSHPIVFHFTSKHAAWINPVETWFCILARKLLRCANVTSEEHLKQHVEAFIAYLSAIKAKSFGRTMDGKLLTV